MKRYYIQAAYRKRQLPYSGVHLTWVVDATSAEAALRWAEEQVMALSDAPADVVVQTLAGHLAEVARRVDGPADAWVEGEDW